MQADLTDIPKGHKAFGSDIPENEIANARQWIEENRLTANFKVADMTENHYHGLIFNVSFSWNALNHNTIGNIDKAAGNTYDSLCDGDLFMATLISTKG